MSAAEDGEGAGDDSRFAVFREAPFRWFALSRFFSGTAMTLLGSAVAWHVYGLTHQPAQLGIVGLIRFLPSLLFSLPAGAVADTIERRRLIQMAQVVPLLCSSTLCLLSATDRIGLPVLYGAVLLAATAGVFEQPARASLLPQLVSRERFPRAVTLMSTLLFLGFATGPVLTGFATGHFGIAAAYGLHAVLVAISISSLTRLPRLPRVANPARVTWGAIVEGIRYVWHNPVVLGCMTLDMFAVVLGGATALLPAYARDILHVGADGYGLLSGSLEIGSLAMSSLLVFRPGFRRAGRALLWGVVAYGLATIAFGVSRSYALSVACYMMVGMADAVSVVLRSTMIQLATPDALRGRVSSVNFIFIGASNNIGQAESGFLAELTSPTFAVVFGGFGCLFVAAVVAWRIPELRRYRLAE
ncbi:MAG TPA: MFS transporter [Myxococcota bacterium]|nr:MFS transporter [Myxococcota bacterium]